MLRSGPLRLCSHGSLTAVLLASPPQAIATLQPDSSPALQVAAPDSQKLLSRIRGEQRRFERVRRERLPRGYGGGRHPCDERVGRFCFWHDDDEPWFPKPEDEAVTRSRNRLLAKLDTAATYLPGDSWIAGQRVRYLIEAQRSDAALEAARWCRAEVWWCLALRGFALHALQEYRLADTVFAQAIGAMRERQRCEWTDLSLLLEPAARAPYRAMPCDWRAGANERIWWLADPLYLVPGNARRTEHYARLVWDHLARDAATVRQMRWGGDSRELLLRYGWPIGWEREPVSVYRPTEYSIVGHQQNEGRSFLPRREVMEAPTNIGPTEWEIDVPRARSEYAPAYAIFGDLPHQLTVFYRGDSSIVVSTYDIRGDSVPEDAPVTVGMFAAANERESPAQVIEQNAAPRGQLRLTVPSQPVVISVEALAGTHHRAGRARYGIRPPLISASRVGVSDLLLLEADDSIPHVPDGEFPRARASTRVRPPARLVIYWEVYVEEEVALELQIALTLTKQGKSVFRALAEAVGLVGSGTSPVSIRWQEATGLTARVIPRSLVVDVPALPDGRYVLQLQVLLPDGEVLTSARSLTLER